MRCGLDEVPEHSGSREAEGEEEEGGHPGAGPGREEGGGRRVWRGLRNPVSVRDTTELRT